MPKKHSVLKPFPIGSKFIKFSFPFKCKNFFKFKTPILIALEDARDKI
ncbi:hypothetical protein AmDm5_0869 [Acetobacter malorum]|nr:hypothetical protein AmDm5_0869 [Acetobacter malorum]